MSEVPQWHRAQRHSPATIKFVVPLNYILNSLPHHPHLLAGIKPPSSSSRVSLSYHKWTNTDTSSQGTHQLSRVYVLVATVGSYPRPGLVHLTPLKRSVLRLWCSLLCMVFFSFFANTASSSPSKHPVSQKSLSYRLFLLVCFRCALRAGHSTRRFR